MLGKNQDMELIIGIVFVLVLGAGLFAILAGNSLPGADDDPSVKVKDANTSETLSLDSFSSSGNSSITSLNLDKKEDTITNNTPNTNTNNSGNSEIKKFTRPPELSLQEDSNYEAVLNTSEGQIKINLFQDQTPLTVNNFVFLANQGFYDGTRSHRIIKNFMVQFGDPLTKDQTLKNLWGTGDPGYKFADEDFAGDYERGIVAMANSGPNTNGSQFFIMHQTTPLPKNYVIFGKVEDEASLAVLDAIAQTPVTRSASGEESSPTRDVLISSIDINVNN